MENLNLKSSERLDDLLVAGLKLIQDTNLFCFGTDAVELANFVSSVGKGFNNACDLGAGNGIISVLLAGKKNYKVTAVEIQEQVFELCKRNIKLNNMEDKITPINADMKDFCSGSNVGAFDVVVSNPPYEIVGTGKQSQSQAVKIARSEEKITLEQVVKCANNILKFGGKFYLVHKAERLAEALTLCSTNNLEPKILQVLTPNTTKNPHLFLLSCTKGGKVGLTVCKEREVLPYGL